MSLEPPVPGSWSILTAHDDYQRGRRVAVCWRGLDGSLSQLQEAAFDPVTPGMMSDTVGPQHGEAFLQAALDAAWEAGLRPAGLSDARRETAALENHLDDMRAIAFTAMKLAEAPVRKKRA